MLGLAKHLGLIPTILLLIVITALCIFLEGKSSMLQGVSVFAGCIVMIELLYWGNDSFAHKDQDKRRTRRLLAVLYILVALCGIGAIVLNVLLLMMGIETGT